MNEAKQFFTLENHATDYTQIIQDMSSLYKYLADFEEAEDRRSKMHKRRIDLLSDVLKELNPQYYLGVCRQLHYELGETHSAMVDCKYSLAGQTKPDQHLANKINTLAKAGINNFFDYLDTFKDTKSKMPDKFPEDSVRPALVAWFHLGRLWSKIVDNSNEGQANYLMKSVYYYKSIVDYCNSNPEIKDLVSEEYTVCSEMVNLLPIKIARLKNSS